MTVVVITGSTRGIGRGIAKSMLQQRAECRVVVSGRSETGSAEAATEIAGEAKVDEDRVLGVGCEVADGAQVQALWDAAVGRFGRVDIWINNAGVVNRAVPFCELEPAEIDELVATNIAGVMHGSRVAMQGLAAQEPAGGAIYNMEGLGSDGRMIAGMIPYGTTKYALRYLTKGLAKEVKGTPVRMCHLSPGMVTADLLVGDLAGLSAAERAQRVKLINILADKVETVTPWLAARILANNSNGNHIAWLTGGKVALRFLLAPFLKRNVMQ